MVPSIVFCVISRAFVFWAFLGLGNVYSVTRGDVSIFKQVMEQNQPAIKSVDEEWPDEEFQAYIIRAMQYQYSLHDQKKRSAVFKILERSSLKERFVSNSISDDPTLWQDLNLFCGQKNLSVYLASTIDRTRTAFGRAVLYSMLINPTACIEEVQRRQSIIRSLLASPDLLEKLDKELRCIEESENMVISFWCEDPIRQEIKRDRYLQWPIKWVNDYVNKSETCLSILNSWSHIERFLYFRDYLLGFLFVTTHHGLALAHAQSPAMVEEMATWLQHDRGITAGPMLSECLPRLEDTIGKNILGILAGLYALMNIQESFSWARDQFYLDSCLHIKMMHLAQCMQGIKELNALVSSNKKLRQYFPSASFDITRLAGEDKADIRQLFTLLTHPNFKEKPSFTSHKGRSLLCFKLMNENKNSFEDIFASIGEIDAYVSLAKLFKEHEQSAIKYCFVECVPSDKPMIEIKDFWNQFVDQKKIVLNSLSLGTSNTRGNIIITGPNTGGKSTVLKAVATNILMAQSFGIAPAREMKLTPFSKIASYMNIRDDIAAGNSLFKAQVLRAQELLEFVQSLDKNAFCFIIIDEMFNGTSPLEAEASAYSVAKNLGKHSNNMCLIATHFPLLTSLEKDTHLFSNYSVQVEQSSDGSIVCPFKLKPGISHQHIALDILRAQGVNGSILDDAHAIINNR